MTRMQNTATTAPRHSVAEAAVRHARAWLGTPWMHQARLRGVGVDCVGLLIAISRELGIVPAGFDVVGYARQPDGHALLMHLHQHLTPVGHADMRAGDFICVAFDRFPQHVGVVGDYLHGGLSVIHALNGRGVVETRLMFSPGMRFVSAFALPAPSVGADGRVA